ncbi:Tetratricopeptide repeat-containing protein [Formivibrio citricus]|uniref:Tetratricopeptide repeat-containing protein n=1 Tax=Formivibrio citricus TaxID=83765 RepID=A0A1I4XVE9_9NEIS|nr:hypothetical protein [Formivibrio citricus]SFN29220.1 Tetratricopeptide repeat-containing protein [Formivibrio citricus]
MQAESLDRNMPATMSMPKKNEIDQLLANSRKLVKSQSAEALALAEKARNLAAAQQAHDLEAAALCVNAQALLMLNRYDETLAALEMASELANNHPVGPQEGEMLYLQGRAYFARSQYQAAGECWRRCLMLAPEAISNTTRARAHLKLGLVHLTQERYDMALEHHRMAEELALEGDDPLLHCDAQLHIAADLIKQGALDEAMGVLKSALPQIRAERNLEMEAEAYGLIGEIHLKRGEFDKADASLTVALKINRLVVNLCGEAANLIAFSFCELARGENESALDFLLQARMLAEEAGSKRLLARATATLAEAFYHAGNEEAGAHYEAEYSRLREALLNQNEEPETNPKDSKVE